MFRLQFERAAVGGKSVFRTPDRRESGGEQIVWFCGGGLQAAGPLKAVQGFTVAVLLLVDLAQVQEGEGVVWRQGDGFLKERLGFLGF